MGRALTIACVGADFPNRKGPTRRFEIAMCLPSELVELRREPNNPADPRAIAVYSIRGIQIGYVTAEQAQWIGGMMAEREVVAVFQEASRFGCYLRLGIDVGPPALPTPAERAIDLEPDDFDQRPPDWDD